MTELALSDDAATRRLGLAIGSLLRGGDVVALRGELGAGKTTLVRGIAAAVGVSGLSSPSFGIVHEHGLKEGGRFMHLDAWRLTSPDDLAELGWDEWAGAADAIVCVEWAERLGTAGEGVWQHMHVLNIDLLHVADGRLALVQWADDPRLESLSASGATP